MCPFIAHLFAYRHSCKNNANSNAHSYFQPYIEILINILKIKYKRNNENHLHTSPYIPSFRLKIMCYTSPLTNNSTNKLLHCNFLHVTVHRISEVHTCIYQSVIQLVETISKFIEDFVYKLQRTAKKLFISRVCFSYTP